MFQVEEPIFYFKSSEKMEEIEDKSIQLIVTSPPYGKIKNYGISDQIGFTDSFEEYFRRLKKVWEECFRVLEPQCRLVVNIGDQYLRTTEFGRYRILPIASRIIKDCLDIGFDFLGDLIWQKISTTNTTGGCSLMGSIYYPRNGLLTFDYEHVLIFKKHQGKKKKIDLKTKELSKIPLSEWKKWYIGHWRFPGIVQKEHIAMFPEELPYRLIRMFSFIGDTVLDPFVGSGTTLKIAKALFRKGVGYEINTEFHPIIQEKLKEAHIGYFKDYQYLLYILFTKSQGSNDFKILYQEQRKKGIIALQNGNDKKIILDYLAIETINPNNEELKKEVTAKLEENTVQNYLNEKPNWEKFSNYIIIVNSIKAVFQKIQDYFKKHESKKLIQIIQFREILAEDFDFANLFI